MITRRAFIIGCLFPLAFQLDAKEVAEHTVEVRDLLMGTFVQIKGVGVKKETLLNVITHMKHLERHFSRFDKGSELALFNREGVVRRPSEHFFAVMEIAKEGYRQTGGAFDVTVLPALYHLEQHRRVPTEKEKAWYRKQMGAGRIIVYRDLIYTPNKVQVTLDGVAKGYIIDQGVKRLTELGCLQTLVNIGGDIYCGKKKGGWEVGIYDPVHDSISTRLHLETRAVCTSGGYINYFTEDKRLHHIIDPASLSSPTEMVSVTVCASHVCRADLLSTALFVAGPAGRTFLRDGEWAYFITQYGKIISIAPPPLS